jgi:hypothetical protein
MFEMLIALNGVGCVESNSQAKRTRRFLNVIERALAVGAVRHNEVFGETIFTPYDEIPLAKLET